MKKRSFPQRVGDLLDGKGFYLVLLLCLALIAGSGLYLWNAARSHSADADADGSVAVSGEALIDAAPVDAEEDTENASEPETETGSELGSGSGPDSETDDDPEAPVSDENTEEETETEAETGGTIRDTAETPAEEDPTVISLQYPLAGGEIVAAFSVSELTYNAAMGDWRTHDGIDIAADLGASVLAAADGTVLSVTSDALLGVVVTIDHGSGLVTSYGDLSAEDLAVEAGDTVGAGQVLGRVGSSAAGEYNDQSWLHFSVTKDGAAVDPEEFFDLS